METNRAPVLRNVDRKAILKFMEARERYLRNFQDANAVGKPQSLVSIERTVLETICEYELSVDFKDVTEEQVEGWHSRS